MKRAVLYCVCPPLTSIPKPSSTICAAWLSSADLRSRENTRTRSAALKQNAQTLINFWQTPGADASILSSSGHLIEQRARCVISLIGS